MRVESSVVIRADIHSVWAFIALPENGPRWQEGAISTRLVTPGPVRSGSQLEHVGRWLGMRIMSRAVITVFEPPTAFGYDITTSMSSTPSRMRYLLAREGECTKLTLSNEAKLPALMAPLASLLQRSVQAMFNRDVRRLQDTLEAGG
jgi:hypothetical protein